MQNIFTEVVGNKPGWPGPRRDLLEIYYRLSHFDHQKVLRGPQAKVGGDNPAQKVVLVFGRSSFEQFLRFLSTHIVVSTIILRPPQTVFPRWRTTRLFFPFPR